MPMKIYSVVHFGKSDKKHFAQVLASYSHEEVAKEHLKTIMQDIMEQDMGSFEWDNDEKILIAKKVIADDDFWMIEENELNIIKPDKYYWA